MMGKAIAGFTVLSAMFLSAAIGAIETDVEIKNATVSGVGSSGGKVVAIIVDTPEDKRIGFNAQGLNLDEGVLDKKVDITYRATLFRQMNMAVFDAETTADMTAGDANRSLKPLTFTVR